MRAVTATLAMALCLAGAGAKRPIEFADVPHHLLLQLDPPITSAAQFDQLREHIDQTTVERVRSGEREALAYFILQSGSFTERPLIEPAMSARAYRESGAIPAEVRARIGDFLAAASKEQIADERLRWFAGRHPSDSDCIAAYQQAAEFLYPKSPAGNAPRADTYQTRGLSTDTHREANTGVLSALEAIAGKYPKERLNRVLIVGPGLEFAPRSGLRDLQPQSFQPYILLDGLLRRHLADADSVVVDCVDVNPQVIRFLQEFAQRKPPALLMPGVPHDPSTIGTWLGDSWEIRRDMSARVSGAELNIITGRYTDSVGYDLVVATNVLIYFNPTELALALTNIHAMLRPGGWLIHNESRREIDRYTRVLEMPVVETKAVTLAQSGGAVASDLFMIHRKAIN